MGGVTRYPYPKHVWSPSGGWWPENPGNKFKRMNFFLVTGFIALLPVILYQKKDYVAATNESIRKIKIHVPDVKTIDNNES